MDADLMRVPASWVAGRWRLIPCRDSIAGTHRGVVYSKIPRLQFPVDKEGRAFLVQNVTYYSKAALFDAFKSWRDGGPVCSGRFNESGSWRPRLNTHTTRYDQAGKKITGVERAFDTRIFEGAVWGLQWFTNQIADNGLFPQYYRHDGEERIAVAASEVPLETGKESPAAGPGGEDPRSMAD